MADSTKAPIITTPRLHLREAGESDLDAFHEMFSDEEVMKYWSTNPHTTLLQTHTYLASMLASPTNGTLDFVLCLSSPSSPPTVIGKLGIWSASTSELGLMLHRSYWHRGYMAEALRALLAYLWRETDVREVTADVDPRNEACVGLLGKMGFWETGREERTFEVGGRWCDSVYLRIERPGGEGVGGEGANRSGAEVGDRHD